MTSLSIELTPKAPELGVLLGEELDGVGAPGVLASFVVTNGHPAVSNFK